MPLEIAALWFVPLGTQGIRTSKNLRARSRTLPNRRESPVAPRAGFEPATIRLTVECSTAELPRNRRTGFASGPAYNKGFRHCKGPNRPFQRGVRRGRKGAVAQGFVGVFGPRRNSAGKAARA